MNDQSPFDAQIFTARLAPHRSLDRRGFRILLMAFCGCAFVSSLPFVILGAWPVAGFMGLDVLILYIAFRANFRSARAYEDVTVTPVELSLARVSAKGDRREWRFSPAFVRLEREEIEDFGIIRLDLVSRGRRIEVGRHLGPEAKADFARELARALVEARRGPRFD